MEVWREMIVILLLIIQVAFINSFHTSKISHLNKNIKLIKSSSKCQLRMTTSIVVFTPNCLRLQDNPCLRTIDVTKDRIIPIYYQFLNENYQHEDKIALRQAESQLHEDIEKHDGKLLACKGNLAKLLSEVLRENLDHKEDITISYCDSYIEPFTSHLKEMKQQLAALLQDDNIKHKIRISSFEDNLCEDDKVNLSKILQSNDLLFSKYVSTYQSVPKPKIFTKLQFLNISSGILPSIDDKPIDLSNDDISNLLRDFIELGNDRFTQRYYQKYLFQASNSVEFNLSLERLSSLSIVENIHQRDYFFYGEVLTSLLARRQQFGSISPRLLYHVRSILDHKLNMFTLERPLACIIRENAIRRDWHMQLAKWFHNNCNNQLQWKYKFSNFKGFIQREAIFTDFDIKKPNIIFIHGFAGNIDQFLGLAKELSTDFNCISIDSLGFGFSEKPSISYNQYLWRDQFDAILQSIRMMSNQPIILVGNSIGGFTAASLASKYSSVVDGLVLMNSAGLLLSPEEYLQRNGQQQFPLYKGPSSQISQLIGKVIFSLLQPNIKKTCEWLYPTNKLQGSQSLAPSVLRDSLDLGASDVIASGAKLPPPQPMNSLFEQFKGPILISQGKLDPLNDAEKRARQFEVIRSNISVDLLELGHCPFDENPGNVANSIRKWMYTNNFIKSIEYNRDILSV